MTPGVDLAVHVSPGPACPKAMERLAVLLTVHNRKEGTLECLARVRGQRVGDRIGIDIILVDDGSTDGTAAAVTERFPGVEIISASGTLYWNGGMRVAFARAMSGDYDYYLLLNDDTHLDLGALEKMLATYRHVAQADRRESIVVGSTRDPKTGTLSYGGWRSVKEIHPAKCVRVVPTDGPQPCDTMNGNCVLIPRAVAQRVGNLDARFTHGMGDWDYGFRARKAGCALWVAPGYIGSCVANLKAKPWEDSGLGTVERWRRLIGPKGLPVREWWTFSRRHAGPLWFLYWVNPYLKFVMSVPKRLAKAIHGNG